MKHKMLLILITIAIIFWGCSENNENNNNPPPITEGYLPLLIEVFSHVNCTNCPEADSAVYTVANHYAQIQHKTPIIWEIHSHFLGNDPFYAINGTEADARAVYYFGATPNLPQVIAGGIRVSDPQDPDLILAMCDSALSLPQPATITINVDTASDSIRLSGQISSTQSCSGYFICAILYHKTTFESPPGSNGLKEFHWVVAKFIPSGNGQFIMVPEGGTIDFAYSSPFPQNPASAAVDSLFISCVYQSTEKNILATLPPINITDKIARTK